MVNGNIHPRGALSRFRPIPLRQSTPWTSNAACTVETRNFEPDVEMGAATLPGDPARLNFHGDDNADIVVTENMLPGNAARIQ